MQPKDQVHRSIGKMFLGNFIGGVAWGLGVTVGLSLLFATMGFLGSKVNWVPVVGNFLSEITKSIEENRPTVGPKKAPNLTIPPNQ
ncbi:MAG: hypothetical protein A2700_00285 [Candidatus Blackburnbacteria bacterium RIFCSPHIGHO2_01_FULL_44_64]|uniref:Uncharacterized protein n=1 Tax=Candidatus Blackburnbacteria bacterium RIFCSPHIGHO2_02_FULL_44_20 TaxID=1797516 RepID=A0A1G1V7Q8_9BACT|nr:MAG: hypothetical protein A2700_00285 [Candidatus Blackburnbacteria bacterium RIFCSPHIGHO2_01_FULL_44_64]OGY10216.1 MAG: hypothetical protein A3E16_03330 [Candidatus Blackburnbacteria bacterium RIFCSPHIGHO2_12_FULL_44_25]OGY11357.1 MAG: hypothetical protein A3D26_02525 [Candidatus Blackburnbacteria bacterium RIFCSPHIGHO2_02_FULL_44_20]OGY13533.1 MAG: hypothetical protein A3A62_00950 [Candidatus Blackburnbacteria bacterium RIFCSPLOWO2_01_FULL_44_43]OGY16500.1 MAG: hypothetical protein A3H88_0